MKTDRIRPLNPKNQPPKEKKGAKKPTTKDKINPQKTIASDHQKQKGGKNCCNQSQQNKNYRFAVKEKKGAKKQKLLRQKGAKTDRQRLQKTEKKKRGKKTQSKTNCEKKGKKKRGKKNKRLKATTQKNNNKNKRLQATKKPPTQAPQKKPLKTKPKQKPSPPNHPKKSIFEALKRLFGGLCLHFFVDNLGLIPFLFSPFLYDFSHNPTQKYAKLIHHKRPFYNLQRPIFNH